MFKELNLHLILKEFLKKEENRSMYNVCIIDDALKEPCVELGVDETLALCDFVLKSSLERKCFSDSELKKLIETLLGDEDFALKGYSNPEFFINDSNYLPDIIIFDWDFNSQADETEKYLIKIMSNIFCIVYIYTGCDKKPDINRIIESTSFSFFKNRIDYFDKEEGSVQKIKDKIKELEKHNFSFKFGKKIRKESKKSVENILVDLGKIDIEKAQKALNISGSNSRDLIEFIGERYKNLLLSINFSELELDNEEIKVEQLVAEEKESQHVDVQSNLDDLWKYRLYFASKDKVVRKGDILKWDSCHYLVLTPDCDLSYFWSKTFGYLNIVHLLDADKDKEIINKYFSLTKNINSNFRRNIKIESLSNALHLAGSPLFLPFINETNFFLFPKMISSKKIDMPTELSSKSSKEKEKIPLNIDMMQNATKIATLSEPFLTAVVEHIFTELKGYGSPDYNEDIKNKLTKNAKGVFKNDS